MFTFYDLFRHTFIFFRPFLNSFLGFMWLDNSLFNRMCCHWFKLVNPTFNKELPLILLFYRNIMLLETFVMLEKFCISVTTLSFHCSESPLMLFEFLEYTCNILTWEFGDQLLIRVIYRSYKCCKTLRSISPLKAFGFFANSSIYSHITSKRFASSFDLDLN